MFSFILVSYLKMVCFIPKKEKKEEEEGKGIVLKKKTLSSTFLTKSVSF